MDKILRRGQLGEEPDEMDNLRKCESGQGSMSLEKTGIKQT